MISVGMRLGAVAVAVVVVVLALGGGAVSARVDPAGVTWAGKHFSSTAKLRSWLSARGISYRDWARRHPGGAYLMTHAPVQRAASVRPPSVAEAPVLDAGSSKPKTLIVLFAALSALLLAVGAAGGVAVRAGGVAVDRETLNLVRLAATAGSVAVALGIAVAWLV
jgi:hypothetical protein